MDDLIHCSKCQAVPYDVLMMNCNHNLCIKCAVQRVQSQHQTKSIVGRQYIQCQKCKSRTNLDEESINQLQKVQKTKNYIQKIYIEREGQSKTQTPINTNRQKNSLPKKQQTQAPTQIKPQQASSSSKKASQQSPQKLLIKQEQQKQGSSLSKQKLKIQKQTVPISHSQMNHSHADVNYGLCQVHREEPVMYYCLTCKVHCFCAECVLVGKHNKHDVKVIKKAYMVVEKEFHDAISGTKKFVEELFQQNRSVADNINAIKNRADGIKKTIQKAFDEVRAIIRQKQLQFMKIVDQKLSKTMQTNNGVIKKTIQSKLREQQDLLGKLQTTLKKGEKNTLHFYSDEWSKVQQLLKSQTLKLPASETSFSQILTDYVTAVKKQVQKVQMKSFIN